MLSRDIHYGKPTTYNAIEHLKLFLQNVKKSEKIVEVITGYGSSGGSSKIKNATKKYLDELIKNKYIKDYIWGNEIDIFNSKYQNFKYKSLIPDVERNKRNSGSVFIIL